MSDFIVSGMIHLCGLAKLLNYMWLALLLQETPTYIGSVKPRYIFFEKNANCKMFHVKHNKNKNN